MAAIASNGTGGGNWSSTATWTGGAVPGNADSVTIAATDTVVFDVDQSGFANGVAGITVNGTLAHITSASSYLKTSANITIATTGEYSIGKTTARIGSAYTAKVEFTVTGTGIEINGSGKLYGGGADVTYPWCYLAANAAVDATSLTTDVSTGWLDNDVIMVAPTSRSYTQIEAGQLNGNASGTTLTVDGFGGVGGGLAYAHDGTGICPAEVGNITRNVKIFATSSSIYCYINVTSSTTINLDCVEMYNYGSTVSGKEGIVILTTTGTCSINKCSLHDSYTGGNAYGMYIKSVSVNSISITNNIFYNINFRALRREEPTSGTCTITGNLFAGGVSDSLLFGSNTRMTFSNNVLTASSQFAWSINGGESSTALANNIFHTNNNATLFVTSTNTGLVISGGSLIRNNANVIVAYYNYGTVGVGWDFTNVTISENNGPALNGRFDSVTFTGCTIDGGTYSQVSAINLVSTCSYRNIRFRNCSLGVTTGLSTAAVVANNIGAAGDIYFHNCNFGSTPVTSGVSTNLNVDSGVYVSRYQQTANRWITYKRYGDLSDHITAGQAAGFPYGGSGDICLCINPNSTSNTVHWDFYVPCTASTAFILSFYVKTTQNPNGPTATVSIYDSDDDATLLLSGQSITTSVTDWSSQHSCTEVTPTDTGYCRVRISVTDGSSGGILGFDQFSMSPPIASDHGTLMHWNQGLPVMALEASPGGSYASA